MREHLRLRRTDKPLDLRSALRASYGREKLKRFGYRLDADLSNQNEKVWYNPTEKKLLFTVAGTHNLSDWGTDIWLAAGGLKSTDRYKSAHEGLRAAKQKYGVASATVAGHSLGGAVAQGIAGNGDEVFSLDTGYTIGQKTKGQDFRTSGDVVSLLGAANENVTTLANPNSRTGVLPWDVLRAHEVDNLRGMDIFL